MSKRSRKRKSTVSGDEKKIKYGDKSYSNKKRSKNVEGETISTEINRHTLEDMIASILYGVGFVKDTEDVVELTIGDTTKELVPLTFKVKKRLH